MRTLYLDETDSTNDYLRGLATSDNDEPVVAVTDYQSAGRGQGGNSWESERGRNLLFSLLVHPVTVKASEQFILSMAVSLAIREALLTYLHDGVSIKWPNDIYYGDRKICGILIENQLRGSFIRDCILGIGVDVNQRQFNHAPNPISIYQVTGHEVERKELLERIITAFMKLMAKITAGEYEDIRAEYRSSLYRKGIFFPYKDQDGEFIAKLTDVENDGHLVVVDTERRVRRYLFKEIEFKINDYGKI